MQYRLIVMDLDGTLLTDDKRITDRTLATLARCRRAGVKLALATARAAGYAQVYIDAIQPDAVISCGGALAMAEEKEVYRSLLSEADSTALVRAALAGGTTELLFDGESGYYHNNPAFTDTFAMEHRWDFKVIPPGATYKINARFPEPEQAVTVALSVPNCAMTAYFGENFYRFAHRRATKAHALQAVLDALNISKDEALAFGDDAIDLTMLQMAGLGVAMGNAIDEVKTAADAVTLTNEEDGVAVFLEKLLTH